VLIGRPATGKSTVTTLVAAAIGAPWVDLDEIATQLKHHEMQTHAPD